MRKTNRPSSKSSRRRPRQLIARKRFKFPPQAIAAIAAVVVVAGYALVTYSHASSTTPTVPKGSFDWNMAGSSLQNLRKSNSAEATKYLSHSNTLISGPFDGTQYQIPTGWSSIPQANFKSYAQFATYVKAGKIDSRVKWMKYDPEKWSLTPVNEQKDPYTYSAKFCSLAHSHGWLCNVDPARDLLDVSGAVCKGSGGLDAAYLKCQVASKIGKVSDMLGIQGQEDQNNPTAYKNFVAAAAKQARSANPNILAFSNLSATLGSSCQMYKAHVAVAGIVNGHFLNVSSSTSAIGIGLFKDIDAGKCL